MKLLRLLLVFFFTSTTILLFGQDLLTKQEPLPCINKTFTIVTHMAQNQFDSVDIEQVQLDVQTLVDTLNKDFAPICVSFEVCDFNEIENWQYDTLTVAKWDEMQVIYHQQKRINLFVVGEYDQMVSEEPCIFATMNGISQLELGGMVIKRDCLLAQSRNLSHGMGHFFGLYHTFEASTAGVGGELFNGDNCDTAGDLICDTPADPFVLGSSPGQYVSVQDGCRFISFEQDANGEYFQPDVGNIMAHYQDECRCGFTHGQYLKMAENCESNMW